MGDGFVVGNVCLAVGRVGPGGGRSTRGRSTMNVKECRGERLSNGDDGETHTGR